MPTAMETKYPSARDPWLMTLLCGVPVGVVLSGVFLLTRSAGAGIYAMLTGGVVGLITAALSFPCYYVVSDAGVRIKCGLGDDDVPLAKSAKSSRRGVCGRHRRFRCSGSNLPWITDLG